jgi:hypothetical protein
MQIENPGPELKREELSKLEAKIHAKLPSAYTDFLLQFNGGVPWPNNTIDVQDLPGSPTDVQGFFGIGRSIKTTNIAWNLDLIDERCPHHRAVPIASDSGGNLFCLSLAGDAADKVVYLDLGTADCALYVVASSFAEFVQRIRSFGH